MNDNWGIFLLEKMIIFMSLLKMYLLLKYVRFGRDIEYY